MALKGNLKDFSLTQLLNLVRLARKTGSLTVEDSGSPLHVYCSDGKLTAVRRDGRKASLADILAKAGVVSDEQIKLARPYLAVGTDKELALRLIDLGLVTKVDLLQALRHHMLESIYPAFAWSRGSFNFDPDARLPENDIAIAEDLETVVLEGGRRLRETSRLEDSIPSLDKAPRLAAQTDTRMRNVNLSVDQWKVISFINGRNTMRQIGDYAGLSEFLVRRVFQELMTAGLVELAPSPVLKQSARSASGPAQPAKPAATGSNLSKSIIMRLIDRVRRL